MSRRVLLPAAILAFLLGGVLQAQEEGSRELALGKEALASLDHLAAVEHLARATGALDAQRDREALADAYYHLGLSYLNGLDRPERALPAFLKSAELAAVPANAWYWASVAAGKLGRTEEAEQYKALVLPPSPAPVTAPAAEAPREEPKTDSFQHLFGAGKAEPRTEEAPQPAPAPAAEGKKVTAFEHLFGKKRKPEAKEAPKPPR